MDIKRIISTGFQVALSAPFFHPVVLVDLDWPSGPFRAHTGIGAIVWGGESYAGVGAFGALHLPDEGFGGVPVEFSLSLVCPFEELAAYADAQIRQRAGSVWLGATTVEGGNVLVGDPVQLATGAMDTLVLEIDTDDEGDALYQLTVGLATGPGYRSAVSIAHSHEDQSRQYPGDTAGLRLQSAMARADKTLWPAP